MDIKEIVLKHSREYLTFKLGDRKGLDVAEIVCDDEIYAEIVDELAQQFEALIESYKAELLNEVGEPVAYMRRWAYDKETPKKVINENGRLAWPKRFKLLPVTESKCLNDDAPLYTSDQVAAAILKATKPLEEEVERLMADNIAFARNLKGKSTTTGATYEHLCAQLAAAQEDANGWKVVADNHLECIASLEDQLAKAEQRVAEACSKWIDGYSGIHQKEMLSDTAKSFADALRRGEWRKFVKEV